MTSPLTELHQSLNVAALSAQKSGASKRQIETLVALARASRNYDFGAGGRLTKSDASRLIDSLIGEGWKPDYTMTDEEIDDLVEQHQRAKKASAARRQQNKNKKAAKARRDLAAVKSGVDSAGRRVSHVKFGEGTVVREDERAALVAFDSAPKLMRMAVAHLESI